MEMNLTDRGDFLEAEFSGEFRMDSLEGHIMGLSGPAASKKVKGCVLDFSSTKDSIGVLEAYSFVKAVEGAFGYKRVAIYRSGGPAENEDFCVSIAKNKGLSMELFRSKETAFRWVSGAKIR